MQTFGRGWPQGGHNSAEELEPVPRHERPPDRDELGEEQDAVMHQGP